MSTEYGKITSARFGVGGYQECQFGLWLTLEFNGGSSGVSTSTKASPWDPARMEHSEHAKWTEADRDAQLAEVCREVSAILKDAGVESVDQLVGKPVVTEWDQPFGRLKSWRIFTEVI